MKKYLNGNWNLKSAYLTEELTVQVPGSIYNDLLDNHIIDDPFYRENEYKSIECLKHDYIYWREFTINEKELDKNIYLVLLGIDTIADIYINDCLVASTFNMHRRYRFNIKKYINCEKNVIKIIIKPVLCFINQERKKNPYSFLEMSCSIPNYSYVRKAHSMFGWDWGPQLPDGGIWRGLYLDIYDYSRIDNINVSQVTNIEESLITIDVSNEIYSSTDTIVRLYDNENNIIYNEMQKTELVNQFQIIVKNPKLWSVRGYGEQNLYSLIVIHQYNEEIIDEQKLNIGLRDIKVIREKDKYGCSFTFCVNDKKIFAKGSNYIIEDNIFPRNNFEKTKSLLQAICDANHNFIRVWGGGIYPEDYFFDLCDQLGILVWQDLMFACTYYDMNNEDFVSEIKEEIIDNIKRIKNHPSLGIICGNNENETAINWNPPSIEISKKMYLYQYEDLIPKLLNEVASDIFYWPSSPSSGGGFDNPNDDSRGDMHYWGVWHNNEPIENYRNYFPRFLSEYGIQSFPSMKTINCFTISEDLNVFSYVMESHQKNNTANEKIINYISKMFRLPNSFEDIVYVSQLIQAEGVRYCVEHLRRNYGRCMGSLYWQLNDCWPGASWSSIDYYGRYKALQYYSKRFYQPVLLSIEENIKQQTALIYITNETEKEINGVLTWSLTDLEGNIYQTKQLNYNVSKLSANLISSIKFNLTKEEARNRVLIVEASDQDGNYYENQVSFVKDKHLNLKKDVIDYTYQENEELCILELVSKTVMKYVELEFDKYDIIFSDNYFFLNPNKKKIISWKKPKNESINIKELKIKSLVDTY